jgi:hypothetical protein
VVDILSLAEDRYTLGAILMMWNTDYARG